MGHPRSKTWLRADRENILKFLFCILKKKRASKSSRNNCIDVTISLTIVVKDIYSIELSFTLVQGSVTSLSRDEVYLD